MKAETQWLFWFESLSIASFGIAWLVKGEIYAGGASDANEPGQRAVVKGVERELG